ncbi:MAG: hypothetical protein IT171_03810 [Acidobacteria bacterium]|nr:hypothetical protein [Acidobacteriota bacterium]
MTRLLVFTILFASVAFAASDSSKSFVHNTVSMPSEAPAIYRYISDSDYVAIVTNKASKAIGLKVKRVPLDLSDWMAGSVYEFQIDDRLFSKGLFQTGKLLGTNSIGSMEIFTTSRDYRESFAPGEESLLFLREIPADDPEFRGLDIDTTKKYYRVYRGAQGESIFPGPGDPMHGKSRVGRIDVSNAHWGVLIEQIKVLCKVLSSGNKETVLINLRNLADSTNDEVVRENALYAISDLQKQANSPSR